MRRIDTRVNKCKKRSTNESRVRFFDKKMQQGPGYGPAAGEERDAGVRSLIDVNGLAYRMTPGMSVATSRVTREWDALRAEYKPR